MKKINKKFISFLTIFTFLLVYVSFLFNGAVSYAKENNDITSYNISYEVANHLLVVRFLVGNLIIVLGLKLINQILQPKHQVLEVLIIILMGIQIQIKTIIQLQ